MDRFRMEAWCCEQVNQNIALKSRNVDERIFSREQAPDHLDASSPKTLGLEFY